MHILTPVSPGELIDKITILEIKRTEISDAAKLVNVQNEYDVLQQILIQNVPVSDELQKLKEELRTVNKKIWDSENDIRAHWNEDMEFLAASRQSHFYNDERARLKRAINDVLGSTIIEEKSHPTYEHKI